MVSSDPGSAPAYERLRSFFAIPTHGSMTDAVTDALREGVLSGVLAPGTWLREEGLSRVLVCLFLCVSGHRLVDS